MKTSAKSLHLELVTELEKHSNDGTRHAWDSAYLGHSHASYHVSVPIRRTIAREFIRRHRDLTEAQFLALLDLLYRAPSYDEKSLAGMLIGYLHAHRLSIDPKSVHRWLGHLVGWAEIDSLCQSNFTAEELLGNWQEWKALLISLSKDRLIGRRRASLALLTGPVSRSADPRLSKLAFALIDRLRHEKDILITKAVSWLLRSLVRHHKAEVSLYIKENAATLPKIALRETRRKILTGRK